MRPASASIISRRHLLAAMAVAGILPGTPSVASTRRTPAVLRHWVSGNSSLAPLAQHQGQILFCGDRGLGRIDPAQDQPLWRVPHGLASAAVFRPRVAGPRVIVGGLAGLGAWQLEQGQLQWHHPATIQSGAPLVTPAVTYVGDGHALLALDNVDGSVRWRFAGTPDTLTSYAPAVADDTAFFGPGNGILYALATGDGRLKWQLDRSHEWQYLRQMYVKGHLLVAGSYTEMLYGISIADGTVIWRFKAGNFINSHHVAGDSAYLWSPTGWVYAIDINTGQVRWRHQTTNYGQSATNWGPLMAELVTQGEQLFALDMSNVLHVLSTQSGEEMQRVVFPQGLRPTLLPRAQVQAIVATKQGQIELVQW